MVTRLSKLHGNGPAVGRFMGHRPPVTSILATIIALVAAIGGLAALGARRSSPPADRGPSSASAVVPATAPALGLRAPTPASSASLRRLPPLPRPSGVLPAVPPLSALRSADVLITLPAAVTPGQLKALTRLPGLLAIEQVDTGVVGVNGSPAMILGVDPGTFRQFTPKVTASQDLLWRYLEGGALVSSYDLASSRSLPLGHNVNLTLARAGFAPTPAWLGALASLGLPGVDLVVGHGYADRVGLVPASGLLISAPAVAPKALASNIASLLPEANVRLLQFSTPAAPATAGSAAASVPAVPAAPLPPGRGLPPAGPGSTPGR